MKRRILVVDDTPLIREHLRVILETDGFEVETAGDGRSALASLRDRPFHLVITDLRMPDVSGMELLQSVRAEKLPLGVIVLTGHGDTQVALDAMKAGADDFVTKPLRARPPPLPRPADPRAPPADRRAGGAPQADARRLQLPQHGVEEPEDAQGLRPDRAGRPARLDGPDPRRDGDGQGAGRAGDPRRRHAPPGRVRRPELRGPARVAAGERALRPRAGRVHRRRPAQEGAVRARRRRHALPRRGRRRLAGDAGRSSSASSSRGPSSGSAGPRR